jgi:Uma2 family endonuclease
MATAQTELLTAEQYRLLPDPGQPTELVRGNIIMMSNPGARHGYLCNRIGRLLGNFVEDHDLGFVFSNDSGVVTEHDPDTVRGPDIAFYSYQRIPKDPGPPEGYPELPPELAIEVLSPNDVWKKVLAKVAEFLSAGVNTVCVVDPDRRDVTLFHPDRSTEKLFGDQLLSFPLHLPGFSVPVSRLFG